MRQKCDATSPESFPSLINLLLMNIKEIFFFHLGMLLFCISVQQFFYNFLKLPDIFRDFVVIVNFFVCDKNQMK